MNRYHWLLGNLIIVIILAACTQTTFATTPTETVIPPTISPTTKTVTPEFNPGDILTPGPVSVFIPDPHKSVYLAWFYKPPEESQLNLLAQNYSLFILTHKDEKSRDELRALGVKSPIFEYLLLAEIMDMGSCDVIPFGNQIAYQIGDFCKISQEHPDWFLLDQEGRRIYYNDNMVFMDPGNAGYRAFWLQRAQELQEKYNWDGIFIDNAEASLNKIHGLGKYPPQYPTDEDYQAAVIGFLNYQRDGYFGPAHRPMLANIVDVNDYSAWLNYQNALDGAMVEAFAVDWSDGYLSLFDWEEQMQTIEIAQQRGKSMLLVAHGDMKNLDRQTFALASYLLILDQKTAFRYLDLNGALDNQILLFDNYKINLGTPLGSRYRSGSSWKRNFTEGQVIVNPANHSAIIKTNNASQ